MEKCRHRQLASRLLYIMARVTAERLVQHLGRSGYVLMKRPAAVAPSTSRHKHPHGG